MSVTHPENLVLALPSNKIDQIVDIIEGSISVGAGTDNGFGFIASATADNTHDTLNGAMYLYRGVWSADNGATWQDLGNNLIVGKASGSGLRFLTLSVGLGSDYGMDAGGVCFVGASNDGSVGYTILYKILFMTRSNQRAITPKALIQPLRYNSNNKYAKIHKEGIVQLPTSGNTVINHSLGYYPNFSAWLEVYFDPAFPNSPSFGNTNEPVVTANDLITSTHSSATVRRFLHYRIYKDR